MPPELIDKIASGEIDISKLSPELIDKIVSSEIDISKLPPELINKINTSEVDIYKNATNNETTNFAFDYAEKDKLKSTLRKTFKDKISENDIQ